LPQYERPKDSITERILTSTQLQGGLQIHPKILRLGIKYANRQLQGANARTIAMLKAFKHVIRDYENTSGKPLAMDLDAKLKPLIQFLIDCRPLAIGMGNAIKNLKRQIGVTMNISNDEESKAYLISEIDRYIQERIVLSAEAIAGTAADKINNGDVILTYASSHSVESTFKQAHSQGKNFQVIVVDSRPRFEGRTLLTRLAAAGIQCSYIMLNAVSFIMKVRTGHRVVLFCFVLFVFVFFCTTIFHLIELSHRRMLIRFSLAPTP
jgi:translation initiation factor eIF-2B subunit delta